MKYSEIIGMHESFQPTYDITNEIGTYWTQFIPNKEFFKVLSDTLNSIESTKPDESKSLWLQGTYGTGKSHALAVIKHLLYNPYDGTNISSYIESFEDNQLKFRLKNFREKKNVFPVVLKGTSTIVDNRTFALVIEKAVKNGLKEKNIEISTKSDFEKLIYQVKENPNNIDWGKNIENSDLNLYVNNKVALIDGLEKGDIKILNILEEVLSKNGLHFSHRDISYWLNEVINELKEKSIADVLMIYWDEFTGMLELPKAGVLLTELQNIAELSINKYVYLFVVSHRTPYQTDIAKNDVEKVLGRFKVFNYSMEPITTYHIINASIIKKDSDKWGVLKGVHIGNIKSLIERITGSEGIKVYKSLGDLFPIHPYTAYLATFIARYIGSTERSIFNFLYDENHGFKNFIENNPDSNDGNIFLTADYLFDYFYEEFERYRNEKLSSALEKFKLYKETLEKKGKGYLDIFKSILLLNILYKVAELKESSLISPTIDNIKSIFVGSNYEKNVEEILDFIDKEQIVSKSPNNLYLISSTNLPFKEIGEQKQKLLSQYKEINEILYKEHKRVFEEVFSNLVNRSIEVKLFDASLNESLLRSKLEKAFVYNYAIHLAVFIGKNNQELEQLRNNISNIKNVEELKNIIFIILDTVFDEATFDKFIDYKSRSIVAERHSYIDEKNTNEGYGKNVLDDWVKKTKNGYLEWVLRNENGKSLVNNFNGTINTALSKKIFQYGFENLTECQQNKNIWSIKYSKASIEIFLFANDRDYIDNKTSKGIEHYLKGIIKDNNGEYIVDKNLKFKPNIDENHPLKKMDTEILEAINKLKNAGTFNLGETLNFFNDPPYGLYPNMVNMGAMGFLMREYVGKLYEAGTGKPIEKETMRDKIISLFKYRENNNDLDKLEVRFGTEEEKELINLLVSLFKLNDVKSLNDVRWKIREWVKSSSYPLWVFKYYEKSNDSINKAIDNIFQLIQSIDKEITYDHIKSCLNTIKTVNYDLSLIIKKEEAESLFKKWLMKIESMKIEENEIEVIFVYLKSTMQEEVASWEEDKVGTKVRDWGLIEKEKKKKDISSEGMFKSNDFVSEHNNEKIINDEKIKEIKSKIEQCSGDKAKNILLRLLEEKPEIANFVEKYEKEEP